MRNLMLCGPRRPIGAYGYFGIKVFPKESNTQPAMKKRKTATGDREIGDREILGEYVTDYDDAQPSRHMDVLCGSSDRKVEVSYLHIPNTIEAEVNVQMYLGESTEICGYIKATATGYEGSYVDLFRKENEETLSVPSGEWTTVPLLVDILCMPYRSDLQLSIDVSLEMAKSGERSGVFTFSLPFNKKYGNVELEYDGNKIQIIVKMRPDPLN